MIIKENTQYTTKTNSCFKHQDYKLGLHLEISTLTS